MLADTDGFETAAVGQSDLLDRLNGGEFDAVVVGDRPPEQDAVAVLDEIRAAGVTLPVLAVGTAVDADRVEAALVAGVSDYVRWQSDDSGAELAGRLRALLRQPCRDGTTQAARWDAVLGSLAHDAKNPLNVVTGRLELLDVEATHSEAMNRSIARVEAMLDELSTVATVSGPVGATETVSLGDVANEVWGRLDALDATLTVVADGTLTVDPDRLDVVLERLFENAVLHGGDDVSVTVGATDEGFYVADDGPGIPEDDREQVFEQGYGTVRSGEGYGLFVVARAAAAHGWTVDVGESESGGARFDVAVR
ncbi:hybrid sensor histidine kinase/response regulator [Haloarcula rubra]|uniref:sensor histidine kinase n=1 Tax=Haloarcula rubra TaxID=2487747 RepID=UPI002E27ADF3|nr:hybrid sensor histidine kinase/response regulator [Halomicroarcula rubra]